MYKLLIVDDDASIREGLAMGLSDSFKVEQAPGWEAALESMEEEMPDVVLLDQYMDGSSGTRILEKFSNRTIKPAIVLLSGAMDVSLASRAVKLGAFDCVSKPFVLEEVKQKLELALQNRFGGVDSNNARPFSARVADIMSNAVQVESGESLDARRGRFTKRLLDEALLQSGGDRDLAAERLDMPVGEFNDVYQSFHCGGDGHGEQLPAAC